MTVAALPRIERLLDAGATVVGAARSPRRRWRMTRRAFGELCDRIWGAGRPPAA